MAHINRRYIDKHWTIFILRGLLAAVFGVVALFGTVSDFEMTFAVLSIFLLIMGIIDSVSALYASVKKHGWINSVIDALIDIAAALALMFIAHGELVPGVIIIAIYTIVSGVVDLFHGFLSTVDPTDRFIRVLMGIVGCVMGAVIINAGEFELTTFVRFFGTYMLIVGVTSLIYGVHNRSQEAEDKIARSEASKKRGKGSKKAKKS